MVRQDFHQKLPGLEESRMSAGWVQSGSAREAKGSCEIERAGGAGAETAAKRARGKPSRHREKGRERDQGGGREMGFKTSAGRQPPCQQPVGMGPRQAWTKDSGSRGVPGTLTL